MTTAITILLIVCAWSLLTMLLHRHLPEARIAALAKFFKDVLPRLPHRGASDDDAKL